MTSWTFFRGAENAPKSNSTFELDRCWVWSSLIRFEGEEYSWLSDMNAIFNFYDEITEEEADGASLLLVAWISSKMVCSKEFISVVILLIIM